MWRASKAAVGPIFLTFSGFYVTLKKNQKPTSPSPPLRTPVSMQFNSGPGTGSRVYVLSMHSNFPFNFRPLLSLIGFFQFFLLDGSKQFSFGCFFFSLCPFIAQMTALERVNIHTLELEAQIVLLMASPPFSWAKTEENWKKIQFAIPFPGWRVCVCFVPFFLRPGFQFYFIFL